jgi:23S rRNA (guanosine2251-2'-O)-methyltransferase
VSATSFEVRVCQNCGLRYPLIQGEHAAERCPVCLGQTTVVLEQSLEYGPEAKNAAWNTDVNLRVLLDNVRSAGNVGSILRSADAFEFQHAYLCGITPTPEDLGVQKTALGAENIVPWSVHKNALDLIVQLHEEGCLVWALERTRGSVPFDDLPSKLDKSTRVILVVGNEVTGIDPAIMMVADTIVQLQMRGFKRSFNVAVAFALAAQLLRSRT